MIEICEHIIRSVVPRLGRIQGGIGLEAQSFMSPLRRFPHVYRQIRRYSAPMDGSIPVSKQRFIPSSGTYPLGFKVSGTHVGVKASNTGTPDLALIISDRPCAAAAVFTQNKAQAAPVKISKEILKQRSGQGIHGIIINSGCANAVTGQGGFEDADSMSKVVDENLPHATTKDKGRATLVMSTGVIGQRLPIRKILAAVPSAIQFLDSKHESWFQAARAICTTDTFPKLMSTTFTLPSTPDTTYSLAGMTKGAGMIHPNMATLLGILCTDAPIPASTLDPCLKAAVEESFNAISIDGDTSTNDTVALLANGAASPTNTHDLTDQDITTFQTILTSFSQQLSHLIVRDGEGATKFVRIRVTRPSPLRGAEAAKRDARAVASSIARSPLVKTALYGRDANWGRILCAAGYTQNLSHEDAVVLERVSVSFVQRHPEEGGTEEVLELLVKGEPQAVDEGKAAAMLAHEDLEILVDLGAEESEVEASYWTCDLSHEYVTINGDYRT